MEIGRTLYVVTRKEWRSWLAKHHRSAPEIWFIFYKKKSGMPSLPYNHAVEEALCYGWIDSLVKAVNADYYVQRFSPRKPNSVLSELNRERVRKLLRAKKMTRAGIDALQHHFHPTAKGAPRLRASRFPSDIIDAIKENPPAWEHFRKFPESYKRIRIGFIDKSRNRPAFFRKRLRYFIEMTAKNKRFGSAV
jgi:uncharacterized protein YdeI (YjbR/CyaY-like superfamily)